MPNYYTDYYAVLEVPPNADLHTIKKAYRAKAIQSHPDRHPGEPAEKWHHAMQQINEAFAILSDPEKRRRHDEARAHLNNQAYQQKAEADATRAREQAQQYPQDLHEFESWLDHLTRDFTRAEYDTWGRIPVARNSISGTLFVLGGIVLGIIIAMQLNEEGGHCNTILAVSVGGFVGMGLHKLLALMLKPADSAKPSGSPPNSGQNPNPQTDRASGAEPGFAIADCPLCKRQLRYAMKTTIQKLRCPRCQFVMEAHPSTRNENTVAPEALATEKSAHAAGMGWAVVAGIIAFILLYSVCRTTTGGGLFEEESTDINWPIVLLGTGGCAFVAYQMGKKGRSQV